MAIRAQLLALPQAKFGKLGTLHTIDQLGYVQIDTISVVERAFHLTLWNRNADYQHSWLSELQSKDKKVFEYWGHAMSYLPLKDYRFYLPQMRWFTNPDHKWFRHYMSKYGEHTNDVLERIKQDGPLRSKDFKRLSVKAGTWWDHKPAKGAMELLFWRGDLMIKERQGFTKVYDLTERVLPSHINTRYPTEEELGEFLVKRALQAHGLAQQREIVEHIEAPNRQTIITALEHLVEDSEVTKLQVEGLPQDYFALSNQISDLHASPHVHILSPFDNLVILRHRIKKLFQFDYKLECYTPAAKRTFGYFALPILWNSNLVGKMDAKADRQQRVLWIKNLGWENDIQQNERFIAAFCDALTRFRRFHECETIEFASDLSGVDISHIANQLKKMET